MKYISSGAFHLKNTGHGFLPRSLGLPMRFFHCKQQLAGVPTCSLTLHTSLPLSGKLASNFAM